MRDTTQSVNVILNKIQELEELHKEALRSITADAEDRIKKDLLCLKVVFSLSGLRVCLAEDMEGGANVSMDLRTGGDWTSVYDLPENEMKKALFGLYDQLEKLAHYVECRAEV